jgi:integrase/recombinase XerC
MDKVLWEIMLDSANRIGAIEKLKLTEMDLDACVFKNVREKRGYRVEVAFSEETRDLIEQWLDYRKENMDELKVDALFISKYGKTYKQMSKSALQDRIRKIGSIIGLEDFHAHCIRKTTLNSIYEKTGDLALSAEMGNHKSTETTRSSYIKPKSKAEVRDKIKELMKKNSEKNED